MTTALNRTRIKPKGIVLPGSTGPETKQGIMVAMSKGDVRTPGDRGGCLRPPGWRSLKKAPEPVVPGFAFKGRAARGIGRPFVADAVSSGFRRIEVDQPNHPPDALCLFYIPCLLIIRYPPYPLSFLPPRNALNISMGTGKTIVELLLMPSSVRVWR